MNDEVGDRVFEGEGTRGLCCPKCGGGQDVAFAEAGLPRPPAAGDYSICGHNGCGAFLVYGVGYTEALTLSELTEAEFAELAQWRRESMLRVKAELSALAEGTSTSVVFAIRELYKSVAVLRRRVDKLEFEASVRGTAEEEA